MTDDDQRPFQSLSAREAGLPIDTTLHEGVPEWLDEPLRAWINQATALVAPVVLELPQMLILKLRLPFRAVLDGEEVAWGRALLEMPRETLLEITDGILQLHPGWTWPSANDPKAWTANDWNELLDELEINLEYGSSAYRIDRTLHQLARRVDQVVTDVLDMTVAAAPPDAAEHLRKAWGHAYGLHPDPTIAYREAVLAVEAVACPLVLPLDKGATLGKVLAHLKQGGAQWEMALLAKDGGSGPEPFVALLDRLWTGQVSRHAGSERSRVQTQREAEAAVHLAVLAVQWLSAEVLRRK